MLHPKIIVYNANLKLVDKFKTLVNVKQDFMKIRILILAKNVLSSVNHVKKIVLYA